jgi:alpha-glucosidase
VHTTSPPVGDHLLHQPHHDGSALYVTDSAPRLGDVVPVRIFVPNDADGRPGATAVTLRVVWDGEPHLEPASAQATEPAGCWWQAPLRIVNPVTHYRFLLSGPPGSTVGGYSWLNAEGLHGRDVTDVADFEVVAHPAVPDWVADAVVYQVFPDRFARSAEADARPVPPWAVPAEWDDPVVHTGPQTPRQLYGGDLAGIAQHLDHLVDLGATVLYLTPFFPAQSNHRYDASSFDTVDPVLGGDQALEHLVHEAHARGLRVMGDLTTNHTGDAHEWFIAARADPDAPEAAYYFFEQHPDDYACWMGHRSLPKLDQSDPALRERLYDGPRSIVARWLDAGLDGWRIDVANMTGRHGAQDLTLDVARTLVRTATAARPDAWVLAEHGHDAGPDLVGDGWHGTMDYAGFTRPVWTWLSAGDDLGRGFFGQPVTTPSLSGHAVVAAMREVHAQMPWRARTASTLHLDSHDVGRFRTAVGGGSSGGISPAGRERHLVGLALQTTLPGVPAVFAGDEIGLTGVDGEHARTPMPWHRRESWDEETLQAYTAWLHLRRDHIALRRGGLRWVAVGEDSLTFLREHADERLLVHVARAEHDPVRLPTTALGLAADEVPCELSGSPARNVGPGLLELPSRGPAAHLYLLR